MQIFRPLFGFLLIAIGFHAIDAFVSLLAMIRFAAAGMVLLIVTILLFAAYGILIFYYWRSWLRVPVYIPAESEALQTKVSIIIPARNEAENIAKLLTSLQQQTYQKASTEIIVVDDHSTDETANIVKQFKDVTLISLNTEAINSYKKKAIETGIHKASGTLIITTDADCIVPPGWLQTIISFVEKNNSVFVAAPVVFAQNEGNNKLLYNFQVLDLLVLQGITGASVYKQMLSMCNGANLAYKRKIFYEVNGFTGIDAIASGDDMLLMHKIKKVAPDQVHYVKSRNVIVGTAPAHSWKEFFNQRIRWASKANKYDDQRIFYVLLLVYLFNLSFLALLIAGFINYNYWVYFLIFWLAKTAVEFPFVFAVSTFFNKQSLMRYFFFFQPLHIAYTIIAGWLGQFGSYEWKGRKVK